jgi:hypothetical protein
MSYYQPEDNVPPPENTRGKFDFARNMVPGQSVVVPSHSEAVYVHTILTTMGFAATRRRLDDGSGIRVWCLGKKGE